MQVGGKRSTGEQEDWRKRVRGRWRDPGEERRKRCGGTEVRREKYQQADCLLSILCLKSLESSFL